MQLNRELKLGFYIPENLSYKDVMSHLSKKTNPHGIITLMLADYLVRHTKTFENVSFFISHEAPGRNRNGTYVGVGGYINRSEVDVVPQKFSISEKSKGRLDFSYPFYILHNTFLIQKPQYKSEIFGIFKTMSLSVWIAIFAVFVFMVVLYYFLLKRKYAFHKIFIHVFAILLRQGSILKRSSKAENILMYSWVFGAMILCLAYESVFLSFLAIFPVTNIKDFSQLAAAVANEDYDCFSFSDSTIYWKMTTSDTIHLKIIGENLKKNNFYKKNILDFLFDKNEQNMAIVSDTETLELYNIGRKFLSDDRILGMMIGMMVRKDFCCKNLLEKFVMRLMDSGLYFKIINDSPFLMKLPLLLAYKEQETSKRILTLTDVAPAFIFLLTGYLVSFLVFIGEILWSRREKLSIRKK